jgi:nucleoside-diphosphate-sugar epimerase
MALYLITGVGGFIGSSLARALLTRGDQVRGVDNFSTGKQENVAEILDRVDLREADILDLAAMRSACAGVDYVLHQAAIPSVPKSVLDPLGSNQANVDGTVNVLLAARDAKVKRVVYAASSSAYGDTPTLPKHEGMAPNPISPYAVAKLASEHYMVSFYRCYGLETVCLRYFNIFGPRQDPNSQYAAVVPRFISAALRAEPPLIYGDGRQTRDFLYVANVVHANVLASQAPGAQVSGQVFNVGSGESVSVNELWARIAALAEVDLAPTYEAGRPGEVRESLAAIGKARELIGYDPVVDFDEGLRRTIASFQGRPTGSRGGRRLLAVEDPA